jgi:alkylation response protein AidB-like acyl-CoA dehydrogenase
MNFHLTDEQEQFFDTVLRFAQERGDAGLRRRAVDSDSDFDPDFWKELMGLGVSGILLPGNEGGLGLEMIDLALVAEALGRAAAPGPFLGHILAIQAIALTGNEQQKAELLPQLLTGEVIGAIALQDAEPDQWSLSLENGKLTGRISDIPGAPHADLFVVGLAGGKFAVVPTGDSLEIIPLDGADRTRRIADIHVTAAPAIALDHSGTAERIVDAALILLSADAFGGASHLLDMSVEYAKTREQFGQVIGLFQGLKFQLANMAVNIEPARGLYWYAAYTYDHEPAEARRVAAAAKAHLADVYMQAARDAIEAHGGIGYTWEHDAQVYFKRAMLDYAWLGTPADHRARQARLNGWTKNWSE